MADLSLPPEEHGGDDGKVTSGGMYSITEAVKIPRPRQSVPWLCLPKNSRESLKLVW